MVLKVKDLDAFLIISQVGSGKSSFLLGLLGELWAEGVICSSQLNLYIVLRAFTPLKVLKTEKLISVFIGGALG